MTAEVLEACMSRVKEMLDGDYDVKLASHLSYLGVGYAQISKVLQLDLEKLTPELILERLGQFTAAERAHVLREAARFDEEARNVIG